MLKIVLQAYGVTIYHEGAALTLRVPAPPPSPALSDLTVGATGTSTLLVEIGRRHGPRVRCVRGHLCTSGELNEHRQCPRCLGELGLT